MPTEPSASTSRCADTPTEGRRRVQMSLGALVRGAGIELADRLQRQILEE